MTDVSVIVAAYNVEPYIGRAVQSVLDQKDVNVEVVVVDDASTDGTKSTLEKYNDPRVRMIFLEKNSGPGVARNIGIDHAQGEWIAILDGDDAFCPGRLARLLAIAQEKNADIIADNVQVIFEADGRSELMFSPMSLKKMPILTLPNFIKGNQSFLGGYTLGYLKPLLSRSFLKQHQISYDPDLRIGEDYLLLASVLACGARCIIDPQVGYLYTARAGSVSHRLTLADVERMGACDQKFLACFGSFLSPEAWREQKRRKKKWREAWAFTLLVQGIKNKNPKDVVQSVCSSPLSVRHLWRPIWVRLKRWGCQ